MFVSRKKYDKAISELKESVAANQDLAYQLFNLQYDWNELIDKINKKGGSNFLKNAKLESSQPAQFSQAEIKSLIVLCHPDKHNGKESAVEVTKKLLALRWKQQSGSQRPWGQTVLKTVATLKMGKGSIPLISAN